MMTQYYSAVIDDILSAAKKLNKKRFIIGIDGAGASGKSTLANELIGFLPSTKIVCMDDFYKTSAMRKETDGIEEIGSYFDWRRLEKQVLIPFKNNTHIIYKRYDWLSDRLSGEKQISSKHNIIVEGVYSLRNELAEYYNLKIWIDCPFEIRLERGIKRDGIEMKNHWQNVWMKQEDEYMTKHKSFLYSDFIIDQSLYLSNDPH